MYLKIISYLHIPLIDLAVYFLLPLYCLNI